MRKTKSPFMIYGGFESTLISENNGEKNLEESYKNKYQNHVRSTFAYKLVCANDPFNKPFNDVYNLDSTLENFSEDQLLTVLLYGFEKFALIATEEIIRLTISYLFKSLKAFFYNHFLTNNISSCRLIEVVRSCKIYLR